MPDVVDGGAAAEHADTGDTPFCYCTEAVFRLVRGGSAEAVRECLTAKTW